MVTIHFGWYTLNRREIMSILFFVFFFSLFCHSTSKHTLNSTDLFIYIFRSFLLRYHHVLLPATAVLLRWFCPQSRLFGLLIHNRQNKSLFCRIVTIFQMFVALCIFHLNTKIWQGNCDFIPKRNVGILVYVSLFSVTEDFPFSSTSMKTKLCAGMYLKATAAYVLLSASYCAAE